MSAKFADVLEKQGIIKEIYRAFNESNPEKQKNLYDDIVDALIKIHIDLSKHKDVKEGAYPIESIKSSLYKSLFSTNSLANLRKDNWKSETKLDGIKKKILFNDVFEKFKEEVEKRLKPFASFSHKRKNSKEKRIQPGNKMTARYMADSMIPLVVKKFYSIDDNKNLTQEEKKEEKITTAKHLAEVLKNKDLKDISDVEQAEEFVKQVALDIDYKNLENDIDISNYDIEKIDKKDQDEEINTDEAKKKHILYKFKEQQIDFLEKVKEIIKHEEPKNIKDKILQTLDNIDFDSLNKIANEESDKLKKSIKELSDVRVKDEELKKDIPYLEEVRKNTLPILQKGFKDYFIFSAYKMIKKSSLSENIKKEFYDIAKKSVSNLNKNYFLSQIIFPVDYNFFYKMLNKRQSSLNRYQTNNLYDIKNELLKTKENIESKVKNKDPEKTPENLFELWRNLRKLLNSLKPTDKNITNKFFEVLTFVNQDISKGNKTILSNLYNEYKDKKDLSDKEIDKIINQVYLAFGGFKEANKEIKPANKTLPKLPKTEEKSGFVKFLKPASFIDSVSTKANKEEREIYQRYVLDPETKQFVPYIRFALKFYPPDKFEYVKYKEPSYNSFLRNFTDELNTKFGGEYKKKITWTSKNLATEDGLTLALYDEFKNEINTADFKKAKYVKLLDK